MARHAALDLNELRGFCTAADLGSLGRAAIRLHVSQPSLSKRLAALEAKVGARLLERSPHGVSLTAAGRRLYAHAQRLLESADEVADVMTGIGRAGDVVRLASSHSATEAFVARMLAESNPGRSLAVELVTANSQVVRALVADGRAELGVAASRPGRTPNPAVREEELARDAIVCGVPPGHRWARRRRVALEELLQTRMVVRDPSSNARWTVDGVLAERGVAVARPLAEAATPQAALSEARARNAPVLLSRHVLAQTDFSIVEIDGLEFPRVYMLITPAFGVPTGDARALSDRIRAHVGIWLR